MNEIHSADLKDREQPSDNARLENNDNDSNDNLEINDNLDISQFHRVDINLYPLALNKGDDFMYYHAS